MVAVAAGCRKALVYGQVGAHMCQTFLLPCRNFISGSFQSGGALSGWRALTIEQSLMSGCGEGHEEISVAQVSRTHSISGNTGEHHLSKDLKKIKFSSEGGRQPCTLKVDKPGIQADKLFCQTFSAQSVLRVFNCSLFVKLEIFPVQ